VDGHLAVDLLAEERHRGCGLPADQAGQDHEVPAPWVRAAVEESGEQPSVLWDDPQVGRQQHLHACAPAEPRTAATVGTFTWPSR